MDNTVRFFQTTPRLVTGPGCLDNLPGEIKRLGGGKVLIVSDQGLVKSGIVGRLEALLKQAGLEHLLFDQVPADPPYEVAAQAAQVARDSGARVLIGIGGGSPIDIAKVASILAVHHRPVADFFGIDLVPGPGLPTVLIPTTAGTGSEVTPIAILSDHHEKLKKGIVSAHLFPACAILDPVLTLGLPPAVTAATGMDALIHAVEAYTSQNATPMTDMLAVEAMSLIFANLRTAYANGADLEARAAMMQGSLLAGMAFANAGVTAVHAFAYPIGAEFHIPHGVANSIMLTPVMEFNMLGRLPKFAAMAQIFGESTQGLTPRAAASLAVEAMRLLARDLAVPMSLAAFGVREEHVADLAQGVMKVTRLLANNPRTLTLADAEAIYRRVL
ncbi:MAG: iron-containing alcohol dehydrogenase [Pseudomonadota bacterium]